MLSFLQGDQLEERFETGEKPKGKKPLVSGTAGMSTGKGRATFMIMLQDIQSGSDGSLKDDTRLEVNVMVAKDLKGHPWSDLALTWTRGMHIEYINFISKRSEG